MCSRRTRLCRSRRRHTGSLFPLHGILRLRHRRIPWISVLILHIFHLCGGRLAGLGIAAVPGNGGSVPGPGLSHSHCRNLCFDLLLFLVAHTGYRGNGIPRGSELIRLCLNALAKYFFAFILNDIPYFSAAIDPLLCHAKCKGMLAERVCEPQDDPVHIPPRKYSHMRDMGFINIRLYILREPCDQSLPLARYCVRRK